MSDRVPAADPHESTPDGPASGESAPAGPTPAEEWAERAQAAQFAVHTRFGHRPGAVPGAWLGRSTTGKNRFTAWNYWWQAHYVDCEVDAQFRHQVAGEPVDMRRIQALVRGIRLHNFGTVINSFFDDMAWLALAVQRAHVLATSLDRKLVGAGWLQNILDGQLRSALTDDLGGGLFWSRKRDYKNTAVNGPAALFFARRGDTATAQTVLDWLHSNLWDEDAGVFRDGLNLRKSPNPPKTSGSADREISMDPAVWTYNQGPTLAAMLLTGTSGNLAWARKVIAGVEHELSTNGVLTLHSGADGGLFTGILMRYLVLAAQDSRLRSEARDTAAALVTGTAEYLWRTRHATPGGLVFSNDADKGARECFGAGEPIELSAQLQAWMAFEAAYRLSLGAQSNV